MVPVNWHKYATVRVDVFLFFPGMVTYSVDIYAKQCQTTKSEKRKGES